MAKKPNSDEQKRVITIIESGSEVAGAATGALLGRLLSKVGSEVSKRLLGPREEVRVGGTLAFAGETIAQYLAAGHEPRKDSFLIVRMVRGHLLKSCLKVF